MHLENILLHLLNVLLVYFVSVSICRALSYENARLPLLAAIIFAIHPINIESIAWVVGRTDLMAGFFVLCAFLCLMLALELGQLRYGLLGSLLFLFGCLSKETALFFIPGMFFLVFLPRSSSQWFVRRGSLFRWLLFLYFSCSALIYFGLRFLAVNSDRGLHHVASLADIAPSELSSDTFAFFVDHFLLFFKTCGFYLKKLIIPWPLNFGIVEIADSYAVLGLILGGIICYMLARRNLLSTLFLMSAFLGSSAFLAAFTGGMWTPFAERYMYLPSAPFVIGVTFLGWKLFVEQRKLPNTLLLLVLVFLSSTAYSTVSRCLVWQDNEALFRDTVEKSPSFNSAKNELAIALQKKGKTEEYLAIRRTLEVDESQAASLNNALLMFREGNSEGARKILLDRLENTESVRGSVLQVLIRVSMGMIDASTDEAHKTQLRREVLMWLGQLHELSGDPFYYYRMGHMSLQLKEFDSAQQFFAQAAETFPESSIYKKPSQKLAERLKSP